MKPDEPKSFFQYRMQLVREQGSATVGLPWNVPASLTQKVGLDGRLLPIEGDTIVFRLAPSELDWLDALRQQLVTGLEELFSEPLRKEELHLTLHDLSVPSSDHNMRLSGQILRQLSPGEVKLDVVTVFPCLNISVLVGFCPISPLHHGRLMSWHRAFDPVVELSYWYRPHVTLAYFRPRAYSESEVTALRQRLSSLDIGGSLSLDLSRLFYQRFTDMNHFYDLVGVSG